MEEQVVNDELAEDADSESLDQSAQDIKDVEEFKKQDAKI